MRLRGRAGPERQPTSRTARASKPGGKPGAAVASRLPRARVGDGGGEIETALTSSSRSDIFASLPDGVMAGVMAAETTDVGDGGSSSSAVGTIRRRFGACMITGAAGGGGSDDDAMSAFHGQCARQKRRSRKKYSASSAPQTRQPVKNGCAVLSVRRAVAGDGGAQALAPNFALSSFRRASERTKLIVGADDACWPSRRIYPCCGSDGFLAASRLGARCKSCSIACARCQELAWL